MQWHCACACATAQCACGGARGGKGMGKGKGAGWKRVAVCGREREREMGRTKEAPTLGAAAPAGPEGLEGQLVAAKSVARFRSHHDGQTRPKLKNGGGSPRTLLFESIVGCGGVQECAHAHCHRLLGGR